MFSPPAFRHDPSKSVLLTEAGSPAFHWDREPAVCGHRTLVHANARLQRDIPVPISATPVIVSGVGVITGSDDGYLRFFDQALGKAFWARRLDRSIYSSPVVDQERRHVVAASTNGLVVCFDLRGRLVWSAVLPTPVFATPAVIPSADLIVFSGFRSRCFGVSLKTGELVFDRAVPEPWHARHGGSAAQRDPYASPVTNAAGNAVVCCAEHVLCFAPDGTELWRREIGHSVKASPVALHATGETVACSVDGRCFFLDDRTGEVRAELPLGAKVIGSPALSGNLLAVGTQDETVTALDIWTREPAWTSSQGAPRSYSSFSVLPNGDFISTNARGNIICLGRQDGGFRWETSQVMGLPEHDPAMDITPVAAPDGSMYGASYSGVLYRFLFRPVETEENPCR